MKIFSVDNQQKNKPVGFGTLHNLVGGRRSTRDMRFLSLALEAQGEDLIKQQALLKFPKSHFTTILQIGIKENTSPGSIPDVVLNHTPLTQNGVLIPEAQTLLETIKKLMIRVKNATNLDRPKSPSEEERTMLQILKGESDFEFDTNEIADSIPSIQKIALNILTALNAFKTK